MKNGDLKRFYPRTPNEPKDFVRYDNNKNIKVGLAFGADDAMSKTATEEAIQRAQLSIYKPGGSRTFAQLPTPSEDYLGYVYNITDAFTTDNRFIEGAGKQYSAGTNVAVIVDEENYYLDVWVGGEDYNLLDNIPIINQNLDDAQFVPQSGKYYRHIAASVEPQMTAFAVGQTLSQEGKIHFDITKGDELATYLSTLDYTQNPIMLLDLGNNNGIAAIDMSLFEGSGFALAIQDGTHLNFIYSTAAQTTPIGDVTQGFQNLDENGDYTIYEDNLAVASINDTTPPTWNGVIIGTLEEAPASSFTDGKIYYYDGQYNAIPGAASVTAANVNSGSATNGQVLTANGSGGASWQPAQGASLYMHHMSFNINIPSLFGTCRLTIVTNDADSYVSGTSLTTRGRTVFSSTIGANGYANADRQVVGIRFNSSNQYISFTTVPKNLTEYASQSSGPSSIYTDWQVYDTVVAL